MSLLVPFSFLAFIALGLPDGLLGIAWPGLQADFGLPLDALGILLAFSMTGYILSSFGCGKLLARMGIGPLLASSTLLAAISLAGFALLPGFRFLLAAAFLAGLGGGAVDSALNTYAAFRFSPRALNWLHASYSLGALLGPLTLSAVMHAGLSWRWGYGFVAIVQSALGIFFFATRRTWNAALAASGSAPAEAATASYRETLSLGAVWPGVLAFFAYAGLEYAVGQWSFTLLTKGRAIDPGKAALWMSVYWGGFFGGRVLAGLSPLGDRIRTLLWSCAAGMIAGTALIAAGGSGPAALAGLFLTGLAFAPVFPTLIALTPLRLGARHAGNAMGFQVSAATVGQAVVPGLIGVAAQRAGVEAIARSFVLSAIFVLICLALLMRGGKASEAPVRDQRDSL